MNRARKYIMNESRASLHKRDTLSNAEVPSSKYLQGGIEISNEATHGAAWGIRLRLDIIIYIYISIIEM